MKRDIANLFDQMSGSYLLIGGGSETSQSQADSIEEGEEKWNFIDHLRDDTH